MMIRGVFPLRETVAPDTPLRLTITAALAFLDGSMAASGLEREVPQ
jgi:hypothetical protein